MFINKTIKNKAKFNINKLKVLSKVKKCYVPAFFVHGEQDSFIKPHHARTLVKKYAGEATLTLVEGDHNGIRPQSFRDKAAKFLFEKLLVNILVPSVN